MTDFDGQDQANGGSSEESPAPMIGPVNSGQPPMRQQEHGGALRTGGRNAGGPGRPTNAFRGKVFDSLDARWQYAEQIADGSPVERTKIEVRDIVPHIKCNVCGASEIVPRVDILGLDAGYIEINAVGSASPRDRLAALTFMAKLSIGEVKDVAADEVRDKLERTLNAIQEIVDEDAYYRILRELQSIWTN